MLLNYLRTGENTLPANKYTSDQGSVSFELKRREVAFFQDYPLKIIDNYATMRSAHGIQ